MAAYVADCPVLLRPFPTAHLAWLPVAHRSNATEHPATEVFEEGRKVSLYLFHWVPSGLEGMLDVPP